MGCALSKEVKRSPKGTSCNKVVHRGLSIQVDRSIKTTNGGYIAAVLSANCGIVRNPAPVKALEKNDSLPKPSGKGSYPQHKVSVPPVRTNKHLPEEIRGDTVLGIPILSTNHESRSVAAQKSTEPTNENLETINILELMEGLAEQEVSANLEQWHANGEPSMPLTEVVDRQKFPPDKPTDDALTQRASSGKTAARRPRPKSFSSFKSIEDVDLALSARRSKTPPKDSNVDIDRHTYKTNSNAADTMGSHFDDKPSVPLTEVVDRQKFPPDKPTDDGLTQRASSGKTAARRPRPKSLTSFKSIEDVDVALSARRSKTPPKDSNVDIERRACETNSNAADTKGSHFDEKPFRDPDNLQRALSFKYMFNDNSSKKQDFLNSDLNPEASQINDRNARVRRRGDGLILATARLWGEDEVPSASPEFSPAVSLKDWLPSSNHRSNPPEGARHHSSDSMEAQLEYGQGVSNQSPSIQYQEGTTNLSTRVEECGSPVFDPEMLDSFENAMKHLSKEEWDAVRGMEDSPRKFLRLVKALKKSSSNCARDQKAFEDSMDRNTTQGFTTADAKNIEGMDNKDHFEPAKPLDMKLKKLCLEKKLAFMRQNSLEVKKALTKASIVEDQEKASVVFYSTTTQTNTKIYEDCNQVRNILQSLVGVYYVERSISELLEHEQELRHVLNVSAVIVPTIYVKGKHLVGADSIMQLYKKGLLGAMLQEAVSFGSNTSMACICRGGKVLICPFCKGRCRLSRLGEGTLLCSYCSGNGLIKCLSCSST